MFVLQAINNSSRCVNVVHMYVYTCKTDAVLVLGAAFHDDNNFLSANTGKIVNIQHSTNTYDTIPCS